MFSSKHAMNLEPTKPSKNLFLGTAMHEAIEAYYDSNRSKEAADERFAEWTNERMGEIQKEANGLWQEEVEEIHEQIELGSSMIDQYVRYAQQHDDAYFEEVIDTELEGEVTIPGTDHTFVYIVDALLRDSHDRLWIHEYKTRSSLSRDENFDLKIQPVSYLWSLSKDRGENIEGVIFTRQRKKKPTEISINKDGTPSKRKVVTTYSRYKEKLIECFGSVEEAPDEYDEMLEYYKNKDNQFVKRQRVRKSQDELDAIAQQIKKQVEDVEGSIDNDFEDCYPSVGSHCKWCDFESPCVSMNRNDDTEFLLEQNFQER